MPGGNGMGPFGNGPRTGGGRGRCARGTDTSVGRGRGRRRHRGGRSDDTPYDDFVSRQPFELDDLKRVGRLLEQQLQLIIQRIGRLESLNTDPTRKGQP